MLLKPSILLLRYHLRKAKEQKSKNITQKEIKFTFAWCSWIFDLTSDGQDTTITIFTHQSFPSERYIRLILLLLDRPLCPDDMRVVGQWCSTPFT